MSPEQIKALADRGCTVVVDRYVVVDDGENINGLDEDGEPRVNRDKDGRIQDVFCVLPRGKAVRVFRASSQTELKLKLSGNRPDIEMEKTDVEIDSGDIRRV